MADGINDPGKELIVDVLRGNIADWAPQDVSMFNDATDTITDTDDLSAISTEPSGASFARQSVAAGDMTPVDQGNAATWDLDYADQTFDTSDSSQSVDEWFAVHNFQSDDTGDSSATDHLIMRGSLDSTYDLSDFSQVTLQDAGVKVDG